ncbi:FkbM family methyltransferase [Rubritepida flocculans]|uniref:FkbM family methyltransferase n=1 Tax=Rubritepida flocculans TaxID=182403 RepID=UPI00040B9778|nr:FkbM family methyltransferase [Rubritepida flocculans]
MPIAEHVVVWAYRIILGREPESAEVVANWQGADDPRALAAAFLASPEHRALRGRPFAPRIAAAPDAEALDAWRQLRFGARPPPDAPAPPAEIAALREGLLAAFPEAPPPVRLGGRALSLSAPAGDDYARALAAEAAAQEGLLRVTRALLPDGGEGAVLLDGGANLGLGALAMGLGAPRHARLLAFEPNAALRAHLAQNLARHGLARAECRAEALGAAPGEAVLRVPRDNASVAFLAGPDAPAPHGWAEDQRVPVTTLDAVAASLPRLDLVKLDLEGSEPAALAGGREALRRFRPLVQVEFNLWTLMRFADRNPFRVMEEWAALFPHLVVLREGRPRVVEGPFARSDLVHEVLMSPLRYEDLILCHDLGWLARWEG